MSQDRLSFSIGHVFASDGRRIYGPKTMIYIYDIHQAAEFCECTEQTIRRWVAQGALPCYKTCIDDAIPVEKSKNQGRVYFLKSDLINALRLTLDVPTEGFNVEDKARNRNVHRQPEEG